MSYVSVSIPREELLELLEMSEKSPTKLPLSVETLTKFRERLEEADHWQLERRLEAMAEADVAIPLLLEAQKQGTYLRTESVWRNQAAPYVVAPRSFTLGHSAFVLEIRGYPTQTVGEKTNHGFHVLGHRLRPNGDDRWAVDGREVYRYGGRCENCGKTRDEAATNSCSFQSVHNFYEQLESAPNAA